MIRPGLSRARIVARTEGVGDQWVIRSLESVGGEGWTSLKSDEHTTVFVGVLAGGWSIVKTHALTRPKDSLAAIFRRTRLHRQFRGTVRSIRAGIPAAIVRLVIRGRDEEGRVIDTLIMERVPGRSVLEIFADAETNEETKRELAELVGALTHTLLAEGLFNRDHKPSNIIVDESRGGFRPVLIDCVGVRKAKTGDTIERLLKNLVVELIGYSCAPSSTSAWRALCASLPDASRHERKAAW
ncbi:MAG: lipopolysaccharide kinase InaA family protein, partial [Planctomycetota bacterium]